MPVGGGNEIASALWSQLVIVDTVDQVLGGYCLMILRNVDGSGNCQSLLDQPRCNGDHPLNGNLTSLFFIGRFTIARRYRKVGIEIGVAKTPTPRCYVKPGISWWVRDRPPSKFKRFIEQINIG